MARRSFHLETQRQIADLVEKYRAAAGPSKEPLLVADRAREGPAKMAEELALEQMLRDRAAIHGEENAIPPLTEMVDRAGDDLLTHAALASDQHRALRRRDPLYEVHDVAHRGRAPDQVVEVPMARDLAPEELVLPRDLAMAQQMVDLVQDVVEAERLQG